MRPTPETDALVRARKSEGFLDFARNLERQRDEAREQRDYYMRKFSEAFARFTESSDAGNTVLMQRDELLAALEESQFLFAHGVGWGGPDKENSERNINEAQEIMKRARAAIAAVKGEK